MAANQKSKPFFDRHARARFRLWATVYLIGLFIALLPELTKFGLEQDSWIIIEWVEEQKRKWLEGGDAGRWVAWTYTVLVSSTCIIASSQVTARRYEMMWEEIKPLDKQIGWKVILGGWKEANGRSSFPNMTIAELLASSGAILMLFALSVDGLHRFISLCLIIAYLPMVIGIIRLDPFYRVPFYSWIGLIFALVFPALLLNAAETRSLQYENIIGTSLRIGFTSVAVVVIILLVLFLNLFGVDGLFDRALRILPARRLLQQRSVKMRNLSAYIEFFLYLDLTLFAFASIGLGALLYYLATIENSFLIFITFNAIISIPMIFGMVSTLNKVRVGPAKFIRRLGLQYVLIKIVFANVLVLIGYTIGWIVAQIYLITFGPVGEYLIPDIIFSFRDVPPLGLPFVSQLNAAIICMMVVCSISWLLTVIALRSWRKATSVSVLSVCLAYLPLLSPSIDAFITTFLPIFEQVPKVILLLAVPAIQGLVMTEVDEITEMEHEAAVCSGCQAIASSVDAQFCGFCGAKLAFASTDRRDSVEKGS